MNMTRKTFTTGMAALATAAIGGGVRRAAAEDAGDPTTPLAAGQETVFFKNSAMEFSFLTGLGNVYYQGNNLGKFLHIAKTVKDGDAAAAFAAFRDAGDEAAGIAAASMAKGHKVSARQAWLWAQSYYATATDFADAAGGTEAFLPTWEKLDAAWNNAVAVFDRPAELVDIPYEGTTLRGYYFRAPGATGRRPLLIMNNGSDGPLIGMWSLGGSGALARGYDMLTFDGPGQGYALWKQHLYFRPDWEKVITPVVDFALTLDTVDPGRIALMGISQGGYWVPRAVAFEHRIKAAVADPGVVDVSTSWTQHMPRELLDLVAAGEKDAFNAAMDEGMTPEMKAGLAFRMRPYGLDTVYDVIRAVQTYNLTDVAGQITCPMLITDPENESFWPGQSQQLYDLLKAPKTLVPFTVEEGADLHCEPKALGLRELRIFDWLDETLA